VALDPPVEELRKALMYQEKLLQMLGVGEEDRVVIGANGEICTLVGWEAHMK
jgi:hypothetical protein